MTMIINTNPPSNVHLLWLYYLLSVLVTVLELCSTPIMMSVRTISNWSTPIPQISVRTIPNLIEFHLIEVSISYAARIPRHRGQRHQSPPLLPAGWPATASAHLRARRARCSGAVAARVPTTIFTITEITRVSDSEEAAAE